AHSIVELAADRDIDRLIDRGRKHGATVAAVVSGQVGATTEKTDAQWRARNDHRLNTLMSSSKYSTARVRSGAMWLAAHWNFPSRPAAPVCSKIERSPARRAISTSLV